MEKRIFSELYTKIGNELIDVEGALRQLRGLNIVYLRSDNEKTELRADVDIMPDKFRCFADVVLTIFESNVALFNSEQIRILIFQQLLKLDVVPRDDDAPKIKLKEYDLEDFKTIIRRFGTDWDSIGPELPFEDDEEANAETVDSSFDIFQENK